VLHETPASATNLLLDCRHTLTWRNASVRQQQ